MYTTVEAVRAALSDSSVNLLMEGRYTEVPDEREAIILPLIQSAIEEASGTIDGYLMAKYPVPLQNAPKVLSNITKDMAIYNLLSRVGIEEDSRDKVIIDKQNGAIRFLEKVSKGEIQLATASVSTPSDFPSSQPSSVQTATCAIFSRQSMKGY